MRFLADMGVSGRVTRWLATQGHDVVHLRDRGLQRLPDDQIVNLAAVESRAILTFDLDFSEIIALSREKTTSAIIFRLNNTISPFVIERLQHALACATSEINDGAIVMVEDTRIRVRPLPIGS